MTHRDQQAAGFFEQVHDRFATLDKPRRTGYIGPAPYLLILRWVIVFGIPFRIVLHKPDYEGRVLPVLAAALVGLILAIILSKWRIDTRLPSAKRKALMVVVLDIAVFTAVYLSTERLQSDTFLFFFLPILTAAEYLPTSWIAGVFAAVTAAFAAIIFWTQAGDHTANMTLKEAYLRVYLGREFFLLGLICTAWYLFQHERRQEAELVKAFNALHQASDEAQALFDFSARVDQLFLSEDLMRAAVTLATDTPKGDWGFGLVFRDGAQPWDFRYSPAGSSALPDQSTIDQMFRAAEKGVAPSDLLGTAVEFLGVGDRKLGLVAVGVVDRPLPLTAPAFLKALTGPLLNGLRRSLLISCLHRIDRATLRAFDFDGELNDTLRQVTEDLHMEFGTITLKDDYRGVVETVRGRNVPTGLLRRSRYPIEQRDIQTHVIATGKTVILDTNSDLFNQEIFEYFEHHKLARIWVPLRNGTEVIGTIEAGCAKERKNQVLTEARSRALEELAARKAPVLCQLRPQALLSLIAHEAIGLIAADSASVHVFQASQPLPAEGLLAITQEEFAEHFHCEEPVLAAGAGNSGPDFIRKYAPRPKGIGWKVILEAWRGNPEGCQSLEDDHLKAANAAIYGEGVRAILAIPLRVGANLAGVLYVHHWKPHKFTPQEIQIERVFAAQIEVAIQSYFLLRTTGVAVHDSRSLLDWLSVMQSPERFGDSTAVMEELAQRLLLLADASNVVLYQYVKERSEFLRPILKGKLLYPAEMRTEVEKSHIVYQLHGEKLPQFYPEITTQRPEVVANSGDSARRRFADREEIRSCAILELRARPDDELFGLLFVNYRKPQHFSREVQNIMQVLAASAASVIRTARFYDWHKKRQQHIDSLRQIDSAIVDSARKQDLDTILQSILTEAMLMSGAWAGAVFMRNGSDELQVRAIFPPDPRSTHWMGASLVGSFCTTASKSGIVASLSESDGPTVRFGSKSCLAVPLPDGDDVLGVLYVESDREAAFADEDARMIETLAVQAVIAVHTIESYRKLELERSRAEALSLVAKYIQNSSYSLDLHLHIILTGITAGESLGFSRAMLFERAEGTDVLRGRSAIGETTLARARNAWEGIGSRSVEQAIQTAIAHFQSGAVNDNPLMQQIRAMEIPLADSSGAVAECVLSQSNQFRSVGPHESDLLRESVATDVLVPFACIPLVGRNGNLGTLMVDNRFQPAERDSLSPEMIDRVAPYAELASMSIETARLLDKTQTQTYEDLAHQLRTPIFKAATYCADLMDCSGDSAEAASKLRSLKASVDSAVHISQGLQDYADLAKGKTLHCELVPIKLAMLLQSTRESVRDFEILHKDRKFHVLEEGFSLSPQLTLTSDLRRIREALETLLENAVRYSFPQTTIEVGATLTEDPSGVELFVENLGLPVKAEEVDRLAERGYRGTLAPVVAATGSGIGLWVVAGIMRTLGGRLIPTPTTPERRTRMRLWFPGTRE